MGRFLEYVVVAMMVSACGGGRAGGPASLGGDDADPSGTDASGSTMTAVEKPDWIAGGGNGAAYPPDRFLTGIAQAKGQNALKRAMADAAADLANRISVRIEHAFTDVTSEKNGAVSYHVAAMTRLTTDVRVAGIRYEIAEQGGDVYALAYVKRSAAVSENRLLRDRAVAALDVCMRSAADHPGDGDATAATAYLSCLRFIAEGLKHDAVIRVIDTGHPEQRVSEILIERLQAIRDAAKAIISRPAVSLAEAADFLAVQFASQQALSGAIAAVAPFRYGTTNFASPMGQALALDLEQALAGHSAEQGQVAGKRVVQGIYFEEQGGVRITATITDLASGGLVAGAEAFIRKADLPDDMPLYPKNLESAMAAQKLLSEGELIEGRLRVEVWADKGRRGAVYTEDEEIRLFMRVNTPAYVRLIYMLENGLEVPIDQGYYIDSTKVNMAVEYPDRFEVVPPFGIEHIHATAFTKKPEPLPVTTRIIDGVRYEVVEEGLSTVVRHRGIKRKAKEEVAESLVSISTLPRPR